MKNSNLNNEYLDDEINLIELLRTILNSKKLIIIVTLAFSLLAFIYTIQKEQEYKSTVILKVGYYDLLNGEEKLVRPVPRLIKKFKINQIFKQQLGGLNFNSIEDHFLEINYVSPSIEFNENLINQAIIFAQETYMEDLDKIKNSFSEKIVTIDNEVALLKDSIESRLKFLKNSLEIQKESQKLDAINSIKTIVNEIPALESKLKFLLELIPAEENNLLLLKSDPSALLQRASSSPTLQQIIYSYNEQSFSLKNQIQDLQQEKEFLEMQVESISEGKFASKELFKLQQEINILEMQVEFTGEGEFASNELFKLQQEKDTLELQIKLVSNQKNMTQPIHKLETNEIKINNLGIILVGAILGFIFSIFIVFIRQALLKEHN
ncbi:Wzz/FepE/Etk N-terminal domain-containing protein [Candidatus Thioglobus sp.]|nr:Wzz/FepE/Etk N-terminal domain-containing protein [Candidatus Thioglobus sp.]